MHPTCLLGWLYQTICYWFRTLHTQSHGVCSVLTDNFDGLFGGLFVEQCSYLIRLTHKDTHNQPQNHFTYTHTMWTALATTSCAISPTSYRQITITLLLPSVLWRCWLGGRKGIRHVKKLSGGCWRGYLSGARCRLAYGPADATATHCLLLQ